MDANHRSTPSPLEAFLDQYRKDREADSVPDLHEYLGQFPGAFVQIATEFLSLGKGGGGTQSDAGAHIGPYRLVRELGRGGQGVVHLAEDLRLRRNVALKVLSAVHPGSEDTVQRFQREAQVASKLNHPGICAVHEAGIWAGVPYIAMQFVAGETLAQRIAAAKSMPVDAGEASLLEFSDSRSVDRLAERAKTGRETNSVPEGVRKPEVARLIAVFEKVARALHAAHEAGIVHRDIKPGNIMITASGEPVILDFGLARDEEGDHPTLTRTGDLFGTPAYMSPEQLIGQRIRIDRRSDVYSLGATLYECLTLRRPIEAPTREALYQAILLKEPVPPRRQNPAIPADLEVVIQTALEKDRERRYRTAEAFAEDLRRVREHEPILARPVGTLGRIHRWSRREPVKAALVAVLLLTLPTIAAFVTSWLKDRPHVEAARRAAIASAREETLAFASFHLSEGSPEEALRLYTQVLDTGSASAEAAAGAVRAQLELGRNDAALRTLDAHREQLGGRTADRLLRAEALTALGRKSDADALLVGARKPADSLDHQLLASQAIAEGDRELASHGNGKAPFERALQHTSRAILLADGPRLSLLCSRAHAAGHLKDLETIQETVEALRARWPHSYSSLLWMGFAWLESGDPANLDLAIAAHREAVRLEPRIAAARYNLGLALAKKGLADEALASLREAVRLSPRDPDALTHLGNLLLERGLREEAAATYREAIRHEQRHATSHASLAGVLNELGRSDEALAVATEGRQLDPRNVRLQVARASSLIALGRFQEAASVCRVALPLDPDNAKLHLNLGMALARVGRLDEGIIEFREALRLDPQGWEAHVGLGHALTSQGRSQDALTAYQAAVRQDPGPTSYYNLANALRRSHQLDESIAAFRTATARKPDYAEAHCNLAHALLDAGRLPEALAAMRKGHELGSAQPGWSYDSGRWLAEFERVVAEAAERDTIVERHLAAASEPDSAEEMAELARSCLATKPAVAARWLQRAFERDPALAEDLGKRHRFQAAIAAARASTAAKDALAAAALRAQALAWLEQDVDAIAARVEDDRLRPEVLGRLLDEYERASAFTPLRGDALASLNDADRSRASRIWERLLRLREYL